MPLILAIEPDRKQSAKIATLAKGHLRAELVVTETAEAALGILRDHVPDLILTSLLLSRKDEAALSDRLRELDAAGTHVQTLNIPVLGSPSRRRSPLGKSGLLTRLRKGKSSDTMEGCEPSIFAAQITEYLERAAAEREAYAETLEEEAFRRPAAPDPLADFFAAPAQPEPIAPEPHVAAPDAQRDWTPAPEPDFFAQARAPEPIEPWEPTLPVPVIEAHPSEAFEPPFFSAAPLPEPIAAAVVFEEPATEVLDVEASTESAAAVILQPEPVEPERIYPPRVEEPQLIRVPQEDDQAYAPLKKRAAVSPRAAHKEPIVRPYRKAFKFKAGRDPEAERPRLIRVREEDVERPPAPIAARGTPKKSSAPEPVVATAASAVADASRSLTVEADGWRELSDLQAATRHTSVVETSARQQLDAPRTQATPEPAGRRGKQGRKNPALSLTTPRPATEGVAKPDARWAFSKDELSGDRELADFVAALETLAPVRTAGVAQPEPANEPGNSSKRPDAWQALAMTPQPRWPQLESAAIQTAPSSPDPLLVPVASTKASTPERGKKKGTKKRRAAQDEWGMYDPEQCGISALMAKLDELEENEEDD